MWYGTEQCCHAPTSNGTPGQTGPQTETVVNYFWIFDPNDMIAGLNGSLPLNGPGAAMPMSEFTADQFASGGFATGLKYAAGASPTFPMRRRMTWEFGSTAFDPASNLLFLSQQQFTPAYTYQPVIHVFQLTNP
jgi:hypothetical protein